MATAASGLMPTAPVLAPKTVPRTSVLGAKVRAAMNPSRTLRGLGATAGLRDTRYRVRAGVVARFAVARSLSAVEGTAGELEADQHVLPTTPLLAPVGA